MVSSSNSQNPPADQQTPPETISPDPLQLLSVEDVCRLLQVSRWQVYRLVNTRELAAVNINRRRLFRRPDLEAFIDRLASTGTSGLKEST